MSLLSEILEKVENTMSAATYAEAGEFEMARQFFTPHKNTRKRVLLGTDREEINPKTLNYAMRLCYCIGASLEIFHMIHAPAGCMDCEAGQMSRMLEAVKGDLGEKGIIYELVMGKECLAAEVLQYTDKRRDLLCIIFDAMGTGSSGCQRTKEVLLAKFHALHCPVVVYADQQMA